MTVAVDSATCRILARSNIVEASSWNQGSVRLPVAFAFKTTMAHSIAVSGGIPEAAEPQTPSAPPVPFVRSLRFVRPHALILLKGGRAPSCRHAGKGVMLKSHGRASVQSR